MMIETYRYDFLECDSIENMLQRKISGNINRRYHSTTQGKKWSLKFNIERVYKVFIYINITRNINVSPKGVRLSDKLQHSVMIVRNLTPVTNLTYIILGK